MASAEIATCHSMSWYQRRWWSRGVMRHRVSARECRATALLTRSAPTAHQRLRGASAVSWVRGAGAKRRNASSHRPANSAGVTRTSQVCPVATPTAHPRSCAARPAVKATLSRPTRVSVGKRRVMTSPGPRTVRPYAKTRRAMSGQATPARLTAKAPARNVNAPTASEASRRRRERDEPGEFTCTPQHKARHGGIPRGTPSPRTHPSVHRVTVDARGRSGRFSRRASAVWRRWRAAIP